jgi:hypothetical protein
MDDETLEALLHPDPWTPKPLTPYDTGARLEPKPWVKDGYTGDEYIRPVTPDDYGKVDFDNEEGATKLTVWAEPGEDGLVVLHVCAHGNRVRIKWEG